VRQRSNTSLVAGLLSTLWLMTALAAATRAASGARTSRTPSRPPVFVTVNLLHGGVTSGLFGNDAELDQRLDLIADELAQSGADVVGVQEASTGRSRGNTAQRLAARLGFDWVYAPALFRLTGWQPIDDLIGVVMNFTEGPAVLSRFPIVASEVRSLPRCSGPFDVRVALRADLATPWGEMPVFSTHLSWGACQWLELARFVGERPRALPSVLMGDFNATEDMPQIASLLRTAGLRDAFRELHPTAPGPTVWQNPRVAQRTVSRRVDFVLLRPGMRSEGRVIDSRVVLDRPHRTEDGRILWPSDHYAVLATIDVAGAFDSHASARQAEPTAPDVDDE
jgi:endonuclease/exonuclease/phosphatase family metal-dependent hydrolase